MAIIYISDSTNNGYGLGSDANDRTAAQNKATPVLTFQRALDISLAGDDIRSNNMTHTPATFFTLAKGLILSSETPKMTSFLSPPAQFRIFHHNPVSDLFIVGCVMDGQLNTSALITTGGGSGHTLTIDGTDCIGTTGDVISADNYAAISFINDWKVTGLHSANAISLTPTIPCAIMMTDGLIDMESTATTVLVVTITPSVAGCSLTMTNTVFNPNLSGATGTSSRMVRTNGVSEVVMDGVVITPNFPGVENAGGFQMLPSATIPCTKMEIIDCDISMDTVNKVPNYCVIIGSEDATNQNMITGVIAHGNMVSGAQHGLMFGYITGAVAYDNRIDFCELGYLAKGTNSCQMGSAYMTRMSGKYCHGKFSTNDVFSNNTIVYSAGFASNGLFLEDDLGTNSSGTEFVNNNIYSDVNGSSMVNSVLNQTGIFTNNNFYLHSGATGAVYVYAGVTYTNTTDFDAGVASATGSTELDPLFVDEVDYLLTQASPLIGAGSKFWGNNQRPYTKGEPLPDTKIDISHSQSAFDPDHPSNN